MMFVAIVATRASDALGLGGRPAAAELEAGRGAVHGHGGLGRRRRGEAARHRRADHSGRPSSASKPGSDPLRPPRPRRCPHGVLMRNGGDWRRAGDAVTDVGDFQELFWIGASRGWTLGRSGATWRPSPASTTPGSVPDPSSPTSSGMEQCRIPASSWSCRFGWTQHRSSVMPSARSRRRSRASPRRRDRSCGPRSQRSGRTSGAYPDVRERHFAPRSRSTLRPRSTTCSSSSSATWPASKGPSRPRSVARPSRLTW